MDTRSAIKNIQEGFAEEIRNMDTNSAGFVEKRKGYESYVGTIPLRATSISEDAVGGFDIEFDASMSFSNVTSDPVLGKGKLWWDKDSAGTVRTLDRAAGVITSDNSETFVVGQAIKIKVPALTGTWGDYTFTTTTDVTPALANANNYEYALLEDKEIYWDDFTNNIYKSMVSGTEKEFTKTDPALDILVGVAVNNGTNYELIETDLTTVDADSVNHTVTTPTGSVQIANYLVDPDATFNSYTSIDNTLASGIKTIPIAQTTHNLPNKNIVYQIWEQDTAPSATLGTLVTPESFVIDPSGDITITIDSIAGGDYTVVLYDVPVSNTEVTGLSGAEEAFELTIPVTSEFVFVQAYLLGAVQEEVKLDAVTVAGGTVTFTVNPPTADFDLKIVYLEGKTGSPSITVGSGGVPDSTPEFCIYGINPDDIVFEDKAGHINALDEYSALAQSDLVVGMGGNLFVESTDFILPSTRVDIRGTSDFTVSSEPQTVVPVFANVAITSISNTGSTATFTLASDPGLSAIDSEYVTVAGASNAEYNGTFKVDSHTAAFEDYTITVSGTFIAGTETDTPALISQDSFLLLMEDTAGGLQDHSFEVGDLITSNQFTYTPIVRELPSNTSIRIGGITGSQDVYAGVTLTGTRTSNVIKTPYTVSTFVKGDVLTLGGFSRKFRVLDIDVTDQTHAVMTLDESITVSDSTLGASVTGVSLASRWLCVELPDLNDRTGKHFIAAYSAQERLQTAKINDSVFYTDYTGAVMKYDGANLYRSGLIAWQPQTHSYVDISTAQEKVVVDNYLVTGASDEGDLTVDIKFDKNTMPPLPANNQIFIHGGDQLQDYKPTEVLDYNETDFTISVSSSDMGTSTKASATSAAPAEAYVFTADKFGSRGNRIQLVVAAGDTLEDIIGNWNLANPTNTVSHDQTDDTQTIAVAEIINLSGATGPNLQASVVYEDIIFYAVNAGTLGNDIDLVIDGTDDTAEKVKTAHNLANPTNTIDYVGDGDAGPLTPINPLELTGGTVETNVTIPQSAGYYFKLQAYDRNNNIVASAVTDHRDCYLTMLKTGRVYHRLNRFPKFDAYHYDRVDLEVYRQKWAEVPIAEFFKIRTIPFDYSEYQATTDLLISDSLGNTTFNNPDDLVSNAISLQTTGNALERPLSYEEPQKSKYITSIANRMVQGNIKGYDKIDVRLDSDATTSLDGVTVLVGDGTVNTVFEFQESAESSAQVIATVADDAAGSLTFAVSDASVYSIGDWVQVSATGTNNTAEKISGFALGWWKVTGKVTGSGTEEVNVAGFTSNTAVYSATAPNYLNELKLYRAATSGNVPVVSFTASEFRPFQGTNVLDVSPPNVSGVLDLTRAINTVQAHLETPTVYARSGATFGSGVFNLTSADTAGSVNCVVTANGYDMSVYGNNILAPDGSTMTSTGLVFPSRLLISPEKFPETFDNPLADSAIYSNAIVDVNADDGEEITGFASFLAISSSSDSQVQSTLIVCKSSSVYAIDVVTRSQTKLESYGQGCTIPNSISATADGIMFANKSGVYVVTSSLDIEYVGKLMEGYWNETVNTDQVETEAYGFTDSKDRKYKLSLPVGSGTTNSETMVYDYITEQGESGSWFLYDSIPASNWEQTSTDVFFGGYGARVFKGRNTGDSTDHRDDASAITSVFEYSPRSFGDSGEEVLMSGVITHVEEGSGITVEEASDMNKTYTTLDSITNDGTLKSKAVNNTPSTHSSLFYQIKYTHAVKDQGMKIAGIDFRVAPTNAKKVTDAGE
jgi:hypothetical protein